MDQPPVYIMKRLIAKYNTSLKIVGYSKLKKDELHKKITNKNYSWLKTSSGWDLIPNAEMKRQSKLIYNKASKKTSETIFRKKKK